MLNCYSAGLLKVSKSCLIEQSKVSQDFEIQSLVVLTNSIQKVHIIYVNANMSHCQMLGKFEYTLPAKF